MDDVGTMTVPPPLPAKIQTRGTSQGARQTVSIRSGSPPSSPPLTTGAGATVFVGVSTPAVDSTAACRRRIPEVQSTNGYGRQSTIQTQQSQVQVRQQQAQPQQHQQAAHVVKIKINPDSDKSGGRVISTVRLTLDGNARHETENGITCERSDKRDGAVVVSATNLANERRSISAGENCVRISVVSNNGTERQERNNDNDNDINGSNNDRNDFGREDKDMVQRGTSEAINSSVLSKRSSGCFYYNSFQSPLSGMVMSSGQCSPSDTLDSGTCSDLDGTPPPLPKKKNASSTVVLGHTTSQHNRTGSLTSSGAEVDSDDNESNISCDSLNGNELHGRIEINGDTHETEETIIACQVRCRSKDVGEEFKQEKEVSGVNGTATKLELMGLTNGDGKEERTSIEDMSNSITEITQSNNSSSISRSVSPCPSGTSSSISKASSTPRVRSPEPQVEQNGRVVSPVVKECTYEERKQEQERLEQESAAADHYANYNKSSNRKYVYEDDRFYKFHVNELQRPNKESNQENGLVNSDIDECFAGYKILEKEAIRSAKGTVRGVKNRVRAGIATFLQKPSSKDYKAKEEGKAVLYMTSSGIIRETYSNCLKVLRILRTHMVKYEMRNLFYNEELQAELRDRMGCTEIKLPQLFVDGQWLGDGDMIEQLNESGELRDILDKYKSYEATRDCCHCGGVQWILCQACNGSKKSKFRNEFTFEYFFLKCMQCDEAGLIPCPFC